MEELVEMDFFTYFEMWGNLEKEANGKRLTSKNLFDICGLKYHHQKSILSESFDSYEVRETSIIFVFKIVDHQKWMVAKLKYAI